MTPAPIALFAYNRPDHLRRAIGALQKNELAKESDLFVFSDGAKNEQDGTKVQEVRRFLSTISGFKHITIVERAENFGLAKSIISGVTEMVARYGRIIVLEDDLVASRHFLRYMNDGLTMYEHELRVASIHGYVYPTKTKLPETFFIKGADCWGWATWKRAWDVFEANGEMLLIKLRKRKLLRSFDFDNSYGYTAMLEGQIRGKNDSWAVRWYASTFLRDMFTLYPGHSFVQNIGLDNSGTHAGTSEEFSSSRSAESITLHRIPIEENTEARKAFIAFFRSLRPSFFERLKKKGRAIFHARILPVLNRLWYALTMPTQYRSRKRFRVLQKKYYGEYLGCVNRHYDAFIIPFWRSVLDTVRLSVLPRLSYAFLGNPILRQTMFLVGRPGLQKSELAFLEHIYSPDTLRRLLKESPVGEPQIEQIYYRTSPNTIHHLHHIARFTKETDVQPHNIRSVVEWGGGYGNMCRIWRRINLNITYVIIDLPEFSTIQATYLATLYGKEQIRFMTQPGPVEPGKITIIPLNQDMLTHIDLGQPDLFISTWALSESTEYAQALLESLRYFDAKYLLLAHQSKSEDIPYAESIMKHLTGFEPFYHQEIPHLKNNYYLFCRHDVSR